MARPGSGMESECRGVEAEVGIEPAYTALQGRCMTTLPLSLERSIEGGAPPSIDDVLGAGNEIRTRDPNLGKVVLYQLSYSRESDLLL